jgi:hypothetical protein
MRLTPFQGVYQVYKGGQGLPHGFSCSFFSKEELMKDCYKKMAKAIRRAAKEVAADDLHKTYTVYLCRDGAIEVSSDSGFESIVVGDVSKSDGYLYLYHNATPKRDSFPCATKIAQSLSKIAMGHTLEEGEGKAEYHCADREYLADLVKFFASDYIAEKPSAEEEDELDR